MMYYLCAVSCFESFEFFVGHNRNFTWIHFHRLSPSVNLFVASLMRVVRIG